MENWYQKNKKWHRSTIPKSKFKKYRERGHRALKAYPTVRCRKMGVERWKTQGRKQAGEETADEH